MGTQDARLESFNRYATSLRDTLRGPATTETLHHWVAGDQGRLDFLADTVLGTISWSKELGRPMTAHLFEGFVAEHTCEKISYVSGPGGTLVKHIDPETLDPPALWDGPGDGDRYIVGFIDKVAGSFGETIAVALAAQPWKGGQPFAGTRQVEPPQLPTGGRQGRPVILDFQVVAVPHL